jgi:hypothetical protein
MSEQALSFKDYSVSPGDLLPPDDKDDAEAAQVNRQHVLEWVLSDFDADDSPLFELIDDAMQYPHEPGRPKANVSDLIRVGKAVLALVAKAVDDQMTLRQMGQGVRHG